MVIDRIKQYIHSLFYDDENSRERNRIMHSAVLGAVTALSMPDFSRVWGVDISHWDGNVSLSVTRSLGASFVFIKGLDGTLSTRYFAENRQRALAAGLPHAPYQWLYRHANVSCTAQAQAMKSLLDSYPSVLPPVIDFEWTYWGGAQSNPSWSDLDIYVTELLRLGVRKPILYTAAGYANQFGRMPDALREKFSAFWFANYGVTSPALPQGFTTWDFWQFSSNGDAAVVSPNDVGKKEVDLNYVISAARLNELTGGGTTMLWYKAIGNITMRTAASSTSPAAQINGVTQYVLVGDYVETSKESGGFVLLNRVYRNGGFVELPQPPVWCGMAYLEASDPPVLEPPASVHVTLVSDITLDVDGKRYGAQVINENVELTPK